MHDTIQHLKRTRFAVFAERSPDASLEAWDVADVEQKVAMERAVGITSNFWTEDDEAEFFAEKDWVREPGPRSSNRWKHTKTGAVRYSKDNPGKGKGKAKAAGKPVQKPAAEPKKDGIAKKDGASAISDSIADIYRRAGVPGLAKAEIEKVFAHEGIANLTEPQLVAIAARLSIPRLKGKAKIIAAMKKSVVDRAGALARYEGESDSKPAPKKKATKSAAVMP